MKRFIPIALAILLSLSLVGCAAGMKGPTTPAQPDAEEKGELPSVAPSGDNKDPELPAEAGKETESAAPVQPLIRYGSFETEKYTVTVSEDGVCHLKFKNEDGTATAGDGTTLGCEANTWWYDSVEDWRDEFLSGSLSATTVAGIQANCEQDGNGYVIRSMDDLYNPVLPAGVQAGRVECYGTSYSVSVDMDGVIGFLAIDEDSLYQACAADVEAAFGSDVSPVEEGTYQGVPYRVFEMTGSRSAFRVVYLKYTSGDKTQLVKVSYLTFSQDASSLVSDTVPHTVEICGASGGQTFYYNFITCGTENWIPSFDWLLTFDIAPLSGTADVGLPVEGDIAA